MFQGHLLVGFGREFFKGLYHTRAWRQCWSCDLDCLNNFCFLNYIVWLRSFEELFQIVLGHGQRMTWPLVHTNPYVYVKTAVSINLSRNLQNSLKKSYVLEFTQT